MSQTARPAVKSTTRLQRTCAATKRSSFLTDPRRSRQHQSYCKHRQNDDTSRSIPLVSENAKRMSAELLLPTMPRWFRSPKVNYSCYGPARYQLSEQMAVPSLAEPDKTMTSPMRSCCSRQFRLDCAAAAI
jgi:hypothetical protein